MFSASSSTPASHLSLNEVSWKEAGHGFSTISQVTKPRPGVGTDQTGVITVWNGKADLEMGSLQAHPSILFPLLPADCRLLDGKIP